MGWIRDFSNLPYAQTLIFLDPTDYDGCDPIRLGLSNEAGNAVAWSPLPEESTQVGWAYVRFGMSFLVDMRAPVPYDATPVFLGTTPLGAKRPYE